MRARCRLVGLMMPFGLVLSSCTWSMFGADPAHTGLNPVATSLNTGNVGTLTLKGRAAIHGTPGFNTQSSPALVNGVLYVGSQDGKLYAFDQYGGGATCSGTPQTCTPLWTASTGGQVFSSPAVANGVVYVASDDGNLYAFDAAGGAATCSGAPKTCAPLWIAPLNSFHQGSRSSPIVANGVVYIGDPANGGLGLEAFDAAGGSATCSGTPKMCVPLWTAPVGTAVNWSPTVTNGVVYINGSNGTTGGQGVVFAFDAAGGSGTCSGTPKTCSPLWTAAVGTQGVFYTAATPAVANGVLYVGAVDNKLYAFDATGGGSTCSGTPKTCTPLWTGTLSQPVDTSPAVANGVVYVGDRDQHLYAFDATGGDAHCTGVTPTRTCTPLWTGALAGRPSFFSNPAVENGIVFIGGGAIVDAFDASGATNCSGTPKTCTPLGTVSVGAPVFATPVPAGDALYIATTGFVYAYGLP